MHNKLIQTIESRINALTQEHGREKANLIIAKDTDRRLKVIEDGIAAELESAATQTQLAQAGIAPASQGASLIPGNNKPDIIRTTLSLLVGAGIAVATWYQRPQIGYQLLVDQLAAGTKTWVPKAIIGVGTGILSIALNTVAVLYKQPALLKAHHELELCQASETQLKSSGTTLATKMTLLKQSNDKLGTNSSKRIEQIDQQKLTLKREKTQLEAQLQTLREQNRFSRVRHRRLVNVKEDPTKRNLLPQDFDIEESPIIPR